MAAEHYKEATVYVDGSDQNLHGTGVYIGVIGNLSVLTPNGQGITFENLSAGQIYPIAHRKINDAGTTATKVISLL